MGVYEGFEGRRLTVGGQNGDLVVTIYAPSPALRLHQAACPLVMKAGGDEAACDATRCEEHQALARAGNVYSMLGVAIGAHQVPGFLQEIMEPMTRVQLEFVRAIVDELLRTVEEPKEPS